MGCANSKESRCKHCNRPYSPARRSNSVPTRRHGNQKKPQTSIFSRSRSQRSDRSDSSSQRNSVSLKSNTLRAIIEHQNIPDGNTTNTVQGFSDTPKITITSTTTSNNDDDSRKCYESSVEIIQVEKITEEKGNESLERTLTGEPETINTWELMEGLEDTTPKTPHTPSTPQPNVIDRCLSFHIESGSTTPSYNPSNSQTSLQESSPSASPMKPVWLQMAANEQNNSNSKSIVADFDPEIISTFRKALEELSPKTALNLKSPDSERLFSPKHRRLVSSDSTNSKTIPKSENKVVIYFTTLRGIRKTYVDCCYVRMIFKGMGVRLDERDVSMHYTFREELKELLKDTGLSSALPKVLVKGKCVGGADEIRRMHEDGEIEKVLQGCETVEDNGDDGSGVCSVCGDVRFVPCAECSGSCKVYHEDHEEGGGFYRCPNCNENGIVRCPACCS